MTDAQDELYIFSNVQAAEFWSRVGHMRSVFLYICAYNLQQMSLVKTRILLLLTAESFAEHRMNDGKIPLHGNHCENDNGCCVTHALDEKVQLTHHL